MHFFSTPYPEVLKLPLRVFWTLNAQINRIRSEEILEQIDLALLSNMNADPEMITQLRTAHQTRQGEPMEFTPVIVIPSLEEHSEGIAKLKQIAQGI